MRRINIDRLHKVHEKKHKDQYIPRGAGQTELMIQNICSTIEVNFSEEEYVISVATRDYNNWVNNLLPRIAKELEARGLDFNVKNKKVFCSNVIVVCHNRNDPRQSDFQFTDHW